MVLCPCTVFDPMYTMPTWTPHPTQCWLHKLHPHPNCNQYAHAEGGKSPSAACVFYNSVQITKQTVEAISLNKRFFSKVDKLSSQLLCFNPPLDPSYGHLMVKSKVAYERVHPSCRTKSRFPSQYRVLHITRQVLTSGFRICRP